MDTDDTDKGQLPKRPPQVTAAVNLLYATLGLGIMNAVMLFTRVTETTPVSFFISFAFGTVIIAFYLTYQISQGENWARIVYLVLFLLAIPFTAVPFFNLLRVNPVPGTLAIVQTLMQVIALILLFRRTSSDWFRKMGSSG